MRGILNAFMNVDGSFNKGLRGIIVYDWWVVVAGDIWKVKCCAVW